MVTELMNWRSAFAPPGIVPEERKTFADVIEKTLKSKEWAEFLQGPRHPGPASEQRRPGLTGSSRSGCSRPSYTLIIH